VSKLANVLFSQELARRAAGRGVTTYVLHPGVVASDIWRRVPWPVRPLIKARMLTVEQGAATSLYCATSAEVAADSGLFYDSCARREPSAVATPVGMNAPSCSGARSTNETPPGYSASTSAATCSASRVLPTPPAPVSVNRRVVGNRRPRSASSKGCARLGAWRRISGSVVSGS